MNWLRAVMARLRPAPIAFPCPSTVRAGAPTELCEAEWRQAVDVARIEAYQAGLAEGELRGRMDLAREIESAFAGGVTPSDAALIRQRQVH